MIIAAADLPAWIKGLQAWWQDLPGAVFPPSVNSTAQGAAAASVVPAAEAQAALQLVSSALGEQVVLAGVPGIPQGVLQLKCTTRCAPCLLNDRGHIV